MNALKSLLAGLAAVAVISLPLHAADVSDGYLQGPGGYYRKSDLSGPYTISPTGVATLIGTISAGTISTVTPNTISEVALIDKTSGSIVIRRTIVKADGTSTTTFVDISGNTLNPTLANLVLPSMYNGGGTTPVIALASLTLGNTSPGVGQAWTSAIAGQTSGSTIQATSSDGTTLTVSNGQISGTYQTAGTFTISLVETLSGATGSPKTTTVSVTVSAAGVDYTNPINTYFLHYL